MLTAYREDGNDWRVEGANLPDNIIWLDLLDPTPEEQKLVESSRENTGALERGAQRN